ncbi:hypothetical protein VF14_12030 [Nostoc linckia z18]|jgi:hypothetical protein|uniref:Uncharacterized protein n=2 Tax=Nostoc linckia TaxID=92942 RepID=A0A9Q5ZD25_NOSLI|nr:hypothetical protein [Nostoc linckia]PHJ60103.1 hypothetical protein VF02_23365 [Nostoc linckia z1]PHJ70594.1 hypothetical protein VF03_21900 [Nostoc linckia z2]PHJ79734.1 hypothetical protein VF06_25020 [Nostoc linckia z4]PHJ89237.1 hypothetical protein VF07_13085 [Nostoc linckia z6]PHJ96743.1 hypothetical protein VF04_14830 [Nostoc linckia z7]PHK04179.1 hypothetical protein VF08_12190 [Nostoc linckia z8]PHK10747.1 hypothetical protein VF09_10000 [Nostoc linckia z9]PHK22329.1 hypothetic
MLPKTKKSTGNSFTVFIQLTILIHYHIELISVVGEVQPKGRSLRNKQQYMAVDYEKVQGTPDTFVFDCEPSTANS